MVRLAVLHLLTSGEPGKPSRDYTHQFGTAIRHPTSAIRHPPAPESTLHLDSCLKCKARFDASVFARGFI
jgi:hypothetical protein